MALAQRQKTAQCKLRITQTGQGLIGLDGIDFTATTTSAANATIMHHNHIHFWSVARTF